MLSNLPKLADRAFILGFFLPTLLFVLIGFLLFADMPAAESWFSSLTEKDLGKAAYLLLFVWVVSVILQIINHPLYRLLEGYTLPRWLKQPLKESNQKRLQRDLQELDTLFERWSAEGEQFPEDDLLRYRTLKRELAKRMPPHQHQVLPTAFGNAIRAFEVYSNDVYGADGVTTWLRLGSVMPKGFSDQVQDSQTTVNFLINCVFFSVIIALIAVARTLYSAGWRHLVEPSPLRGFTSQIDYHWLLWALAGLAAAYLLYRWAVASVSAWGDLVITAFDCYLPALAKQLGYQLPITAKERERFWTEFNQQIVYRRDPRGRLPFLPEDWKQIDAKTDETARPGASEPSPVGDAPAKADETDKNDAGVDD